jgi:ABC-type transport system involved in multi-copper enzyme maturation permease subunit
MATIREKGYSHWDGQLLERRFPWWPVTRTGIQLAFRKKKFKFVFAVSFLPAVVFLAGIYISERLEDFQFMIRESQQFITINPAFFRSYLTLDPLLFLMLLVLLFAGAGLISDDLKYNSLQLYFAHPLAKKDYLLGKMGVVVFFVLIFTLVPGLLLFLFKLIFSGSLKFFLEYPWLPLSIAGYSLLLTLFFGCYTLLLSALSKNRRYVTILMFMIYYFSNILHVILFGIFKSEYMALFSLRNNLLQTGSVIFRQKPAFAFPAVWSFVVLAAVCLLAGYVLHRRIRGVEVIK